MNLFQKLKFKNKIFYKLLFYFAFLLALFSIITGGVFTYMFVRNTVNLNKKNLEMRAEKLSETLSFLWFSDRFKNGRENYGQNAENIKDGERPFPDRRRNMKMIEDIAMSEVWVVDAETGNIFQGRNENSQPYSYLSLPPNAENAIKTALNGSSNITENFNDLLEQRSITVATPIFSRQGNKVIGVVLLHSPVENVSLSLRNGIFTLAISLVTALVLAGIGTVFLSISFTKPLNRIRKTALLLSEGDYEAKTDIKLSDEIGELAETIDKLSKKLHVSAEESSRFEKMRQDFIINVSHELRTPITVIRGSLEAIRDGVVSSPEKIREYQQQILSETIHLQRLVNDFIDLSKLQNSDFLIEKVPVNLCEVINDAVRSMKQIAFRKNISLISNNCESCLFYSDYQRIRQMIIIVIDNAIKFSHENSTVKINMQLHPEYCRLDISDSGPGIPSEKIGKIFDRFHKSDTEENRNGMGLGLAIAKQIALRHDITISVSSVPNIETTFSFIFPLKKEG